MPIKKENGKVIVGVVFLDCAKNNLKTSVRQINLQENINFQNKPQKKYKIEIKDRVIHKQPPHFLSPL